MRFNVLGPLEVYDDRGNSVEIVGKPATLLTALLLRADDWVRISELIDLVWAERAAPPSAEKNLKTYVWQLRRSLAGSGDRPSIESRPGAYRIRLGSGELDAELARGAASAARSAFDGGDRETAAELLAGAVALWRGQPVHPERDPMAGRLAELHQKLQENLAEVQLALGRNDEAIAMLRALADSDPLRERTWIQLVRALHRAARRSEALATYQRARSVLVAELGVEPGAELSLAHQEVLAGAFDSSPGGRSTSGRRDLPRPTSQLYGRATEIRAVLDVVRDTAASLPLVSLEGMPGVGKTTLALHLAHRLTGLYPDAQLFLDLRAHAASGAGLGTRAALGRLIAAVTDVRQPLPGSLDERAALWRAATAGRRLLLVLDDVMGAEQVRQLLPGTAGSLVLVTSRVALTGVDASVALRIEPPAPAAAAEMFRAAAGIGHGPNRKDAASSAPVTEVVRHCGQLPAAVRAAGERLRRRPAWSMARLAARLADDSGRWLELSEVAARMEPSYSQLPVEDRRMFRLLALLDGGPIDAELAAVVAGISRERAEVILEHLLDRHLLVQTSPARYGFHVLVGDLARHALFNTGSPAELSTSRARLASATAGADGLELVASPGPRVA